MMNAAPLPAITHVTSDMHLLQQLVATLYLANV
jgi:hypothetical protein